MRNIIKVREREGGRYVPMRKSRYKRVYRCTFIFPFNLIKLQLYTFHKLGEHNFLINITHLSISCPTSIRSPHCVLNHSIISEMPNRYLTRCSKIGLSLRYLIIFDHIPLPSMMYILCIECSMFLWV